MHPNKFLGRSSSVAPKLSPADKEARLRALSTLIADKRKDAVDARKNSGIEKVWMDCEEANLGIDDSNRHEFADAKWCKPTSMNGPVTSSNGARDDSRSNVFIRITSRYVFGAAAKLAEILLPVDDKAFSIDPMPNPDLVKQASDLTPLVDAATGHQVTRPAQPGEQPPGLPAAPQPQAGQAPQPQAAPTAGATAAVMPVTAADQANQQIDQAQDCADKAEERIYGWLTDSNYPAEVRKIISDAARCGVGVLKGPFPDIKKTKALTTLPQGVALQIEKKVVPTVRWVDFWNIYPDDACGEDIHSGDYIFERDFLSTKLLLQLKDQDGYIGDAIDRVVAEGPGKIYVDGGNPNDKKSRKRFEIWYYYGLLKREDLSLLEAVGVDDLPDEEEEIHAIVAMVNDTVIRATINPLEKSGNFPYHAMTWSRRPGHWAGVGVAEQMTAAQRMVNAATRALLNNAGLSAGPQIVIDQSSITPADNNWKLYPNKIWYKSGDSMLPVQDAFHCAIIPSVQSEMQAIIDYAMKQAEESTGIPLITQGQTGPSSPQTFGAAELQDSNAHTWLRSIGYRFDDQVTEPVINDHYEWLLLDPNVPDDEKGDFKINAHGSQAMVERSIQEAFFAALMPQVANPAWKLNPEKLMEEILKSKRIDPRKVQYSAEEQEQMSQVQPPPPVEMQVEQLKGQNALQLQQATSKSKLEEMQQSLAQENQQMQNGGVSPHVVSAQAKIQEAQIRAQSQESIEASRAQSELQYAKTEQQVAQQDAAAKTQQMADQRELALLKFMQENKLNTQELNGMLERTSMQDQTKRELAQLDMQMDARENDKRRSHEMTMANQSIINTHIEKNNDAMREAMTP